jgi:ABC-2 type transport system ATP-binding protein
MLKITDARKTYHGDPVLHIPFFHLEKGVYWLKGINGSGKTTMLRMIAGLSPFEGDVLLQGTSLRKSPLLYRSLVSRAEAEPAYPPFVTGRELISFYREIRKAPTQQTDRLIEFFGVQPYLSHPIAHYSSGMVKRLSLLLAFIGTVSLILLDEPLATLDTELAAFLPGLISEYRQQHGVSFLFTSHQPFTSGEFHIDGTLVICDQTIHHASGQTIHRNSDQTIHRSI